MLPPHIAINRTVQVVHGASEILVTAAGQMELACDLVGVDPHRDIAVLKLKPQARRDADAVGVCCRPIPQGTSSGLRVGQKAFAIGNPFGLDHTLTSGIISAIGREIPSVTG